MRILTAVLLISVSFQSTAQVSIGYDHEKQPIVYAVDKLNEALAFTGQSLAAYSLSQLSEPTDIGCIWWVTTLHGCPSPSVKLILATLNQKSIGFLPSMANY